MKGKRIIITGGAGYLGRFLVRQFHSDNDIIVFSRDELKHWELQQEFPQVKCILGDVRDFHALRHASRGCNVGLFCASLKHVTQVNENVDEALRTNIIGARNSRRVAEDAGFESACMVSTDKSRLPVTIYGATKFIAGESFIWDAERNRNLRLSTLICGNIANSTGSVIPRMWKAIEKGIELPLYGEDMTRFYITGEEVAGLFDHILTWNGYNILPKMRSFRVKDLFDIFADRFDLKYASQKADWVERDYEILVSEEDAFRTIDCREFYAMHYAKSDKAHLTKAITSRDDVMTREELEERLSQSKYFMP